MRTIVLGWMDRNPTSWAYGRARAACWINEGTSRDLRRARQYASKLGHSVFVFRSDDKRDVLALVRRAIATGQFRAVQQAEGL